MARRDAEDLMTKLLQMSEEGLATFFGEAIKNEGMRRALGRAGERFLANKSRFDRNIETLLDFVSIPSKRDIRELKARLDHLNGQVVNLNMKFDRMAAQADQPAARRGKKRGGDEDS